MVSTSDSPPRARGGPLRGAGPGLAAGAQLGRYRLVKELGRGAMGLVFLADDTVLKQQLCVKVLDPRLSHNREALERFHREIVLARRIVHKGVCRLHDLHTHEQQGGALHFITMEYVDGVPLRELLVPEAPLLPVRRVATIVQNICAALAAAHDVNVIHRDLKPANVMVCAGDEVNVLDFGIATADDLGSSLTLPGVAIGTRNYIAPEVWAGRPASPRSDQFSLGVILFNCLTKQRPFLHDGKGALVVEAMQARPPPPPSARRPAGAEPLPPALDAIVLRALSFAPGDRFDDVRALAAALAAVELPAPAGPPAAEAPSDAARFGFDPAQVETAPRGVPAGGGSDVTIPPAGDATMLAVHVVTTPNAATPSSGPVLPLQGRSGQGGTFTGPTSPLSPPRRAPLVVLGGAAALALVVGAALLLRDDDAPARRAEGGAAEERPGVDAAASAARGEEVRALARPPDAPAAPPEEPATVEAAPIVVSLEEARPAPDVRRPRGERAESEGAHERAEKGGKQRHAEARAATARAMAERGLLPGDDLELDRLRARATTAARARRYEEAAGLEADAQRRVGAIDVDKSFVNKKLVRFNARFDELKDAAARARLESVSADVLHAMRDGRAQDANRALNAAFAALAGRS